MTRIEARTRAGRWFLAFEANAIAVLLGLMALVTFVNVVLRYGFGTSLLWGIEVTLTLFAWLVLLGISHCIAIGAHLGVDVVTAALPHRARRALALVAGVLCIAYAFLLLKGAWDYWAPYAGLEKTAGRWFPLGFEPTRDQAWYETDRIPMLGIFRWLEPLINQGEPYEKLPRVVPYSVLPVAMLLMLVRFIIVTVEIWRGERDGLIVSHEVEEELAERATLGEER